VLTVLRSLYDSEPAPDDVAHERYARLVQLTLLGNARHEDRDLARAVRHCVVREMIVSSDDSILMNHKWRFSEEYRHRGLSNL
jgi:hypothetical protein